MRVVYNPLTQNDWQRIMHGGYIGRQYQRGSGLGSVFRSLLRTIIPVAKVVGRNVLGVGADAAMDVARGSSVKNATTKAAKSAVKKALCGGRIKKTRKVPIKAKKTMNKPRARATHIFGSI